MPRVIITHDIREVDRWLAGKDERAAAMPGATGVTDLVALDGGNQAAVTFETDDQIPVFLQEPVPCRGDKGGVVGRWAHECVDHRWHPPANSSQVQTQIGVQVVGEVQRDLSGRTRSRDEPDPHLVRAHGRAAGLRRWFRPFCVMVRVWDHRAPEARGAVRRHGRPTSRRRGRIAAL